MTVCRALCLSFVLALGSSQVSVPESGTVVPMLDVGGRPVVEVTIGGAGPYRMILDTGASRTVVDPAWVSGQTGHVTLTDVRIGALSVAKLDVRSQSLFGGALPPDFPRGVFSALSFPGHLVTLNYPGKSITVRKGALPPADGQTIFEWPASSVLPRVPVTIGDRTYSIHLDSGSPGAIMLPLAAAKELTLSSPLSAMGRARTPGGEFEVFGAPVTGPITIGRHAVEVPVVRFSDLGPGGPAAGPGPGNVGFEVLRGFEVTVDVANRRLELKRPQPRSASSGGTFAARREGR